MTAPIARRRLGRTGLQVTELGLGGVFVRTAVTEPGEGVRVVQRALELGVDYLDTAPLYGDSQQVLGEALQDVDTPYVLGAKCGRWDWETGPYRSLDAFKRQFEQTQRDLRRDVVDILYIHEADWAPYWTDMRVPRTAQFLEADAEYDFDGAPVAAFVRWVKDQRMTRFLGISGNNAHLLASSTSGSCWAHRCSRGSWPSRTPSGSTIRPTGWTRICAPASRGCTPSTTRPD